MSRRVPAAPFFSIWEEPFGEKRRLRLNAYKDGTILEIESTASTASACALLLEIADALIKYRKETEK
jgi:hypothetical protein